MNGPYVVLDDWSTFAGVDGCTFVYLTDEDEAALEECNDFKAVDEDNPENIVITIHDLVDAYNQLNGTQL
jgi:hypothetical protein